MQLRQLRQVQAATAAHRFLTQDPLPASLTKASPSFQQQVSALKALVDAATTRGAEQTPGTRRERYSARDAAAAQLRDGTLRALRQVARVISAGNEGAGLSPDFASIVSVPETTNVQAILQAARSTIQEIAPYQAFFVARGQAPDFLAQLTTQTDAVEALANDAHQARGTQLAATRDINRLLREIRGTLRCLGVEVRRMCAQDGPQGETTYHTWKRLKRPQQSSAVSDAGTVTDASAGAKTSAGETASADAAKVAMPAPVTTGVPTSTTAPATPTPAAA